MKLGCGAFGLGIAVAVRDLAALLAGMQPVLAAEAYGFACLPVGEPVGFIPFATVAEAEGVTVVATQAQLLAAGVAFQGGWARISLTIQSDLAAVGLTAAIAGALTEVGISANVIAGYHHDHFFVQADRAAQAVAVMRALAGD